ncbi:MAG: hypothetical protein RL677_1136 [Actinomycetota bacterium]|jgi:hypothetical protein
MTEARKTLANRPLTEPSAKRLKIDDPFREQILQLHAEAIQAGLDEYKDPKSGFQVLTAKFHADRGFCCDQLCRHCPYQTSE